MESFSMQLWPFFEWLLRTTIQASLLIFVSLLVQLIMRGKLGVRWRYCLWLLLLIRLVMPWAPESRISIFNLIRPLVGRSRAEFFPLVGRSRAEFFPDDIADDGFNSDLVVVSINESTAVSMTGIPQEIPESITATPEKAVFFELADVLPLIWLTGALALAVYVCASNFNLRRTIKKGCPLTDRKILDLLEKCKSQMGIRTILRVIVTDRVKGPALFGFVRPRLLLPRGMIEALSLEELRCIFLHELAHLKRHDIFISYIVSLVQILHWFNPLVWLAFYRMRLDRELACDALVLSTMNIDEPQKYGQAIISLVELFYENRYLPATVGIMENKSQLKGRINMIARFKKDSKKFTLPAVLLILMIACISLTNAQVQTRDEKIAELMDNAMAFQKQQLYEEAVGQLKDLLAIDPMNERALILKDMISSLKQLEANKRELGMTIGQNPADSVVITKQALDDMISYRKQLKAEKRETEMAIGLDPADVAVYRQLNEVVDLSGFTPEMPLSEAIEELKSSVAPPLKIIVLWRDLEDTANIFPDTPLNMDAISAVRLGTALKLLLMSVSGGSADLDYVVENGVITIATKESLPSRLVTRVYHIFDLVDTTLDPNTGKVASFNEDDANDILGHIIDTVEPDSWYEAGGEGRIAIYKGYKLIVFQTREIHQKVEQLLSGLRVSPGEQRMTRPAIEIESRFLVVSEDCLEDIGLDANSISSADSKFKPAIVDSPGSTISETYSLLLDDPNVRFLLKAIQANEDSTALTAPKVTVLDGEEATISIHKQVTYISGYTKPNRTLGEPEPKRDFVVTGTWWKVTPQISPDKKYIVMNVVFELSKLLEFEERMYKEKYPYGIPQTEVVSTKTLLLVPDGRTVLIGSQEITAEEDGRKVQKELIVLIKAKKVDSENRGTYPSGYSGGMGGYDIVGFGGGMGGYGDGGYGGYGGGGMGGYGGSMGGYGGGGYGVSGYLRVERQKDPNSP
jgi:beta-lactamase regulating signal transducer with metallopeptidase domain